MGDLLFRNFQHLQDKMGLSIDLSNVATSNKTKIH